MDSKVETIDFLVMQGFRTIEPLEIPHGRVSMDLAMYIIVVYLKFLDGGIIDSNVDC